MNRNANGHNAGPHNAGPSIGKINAQQVVGLDIAKNVDQGPGWADLAESTKAQRTQEGTWPGQKLVRKGGNNGLLGSLFSDSGSDWAQVGAVRGPSAAYAAIHQFGGQAGRGKKTTIPARPYMPITADGKDLTEAASESVLALTITWLGLD